MSPRPSIGAGPEDEDEGFEKLLDSTILLHSYHTLNEWTLSKFKKLFNTTLTFHNSKHIYKKSFLEL